MTDTPPPHTLEKADDAPGYPIPLFETWLELAEKSEPRDANAMCLSTLDADGRLSSRMVLLKQTTFDGFVFYTNRHSRKGEALAANPVAAINFHWKSLGRQVRAEGAIEPVSDTEADAYFASRPRGSRIGAWASQQSRPLASRAELVAKVQELEAQYEGTEDIPRPDYWGGYLLKPDTVEFWMEGEFRLHTRLVYRKADMGWTRMMLYP